MQYYFIYYILYYIIILYHIILYYIILYYIVLYYIIYYILYYILLYYIYVIYNVTIVMGLISQRIGISYPLVAPRTVKVPTKALGLHDQEQAGCPWLGSATENGKINGKIICDIMDKNG